MNCYLIRILILKNESLCLSSFMLRILFIPAFLAIGFDSFASGSSLPPGFTKSSFAHNAFLENRGQMIDMDGRPVPDILFLQESAGLNLYITKTGLTYLFLQVEEKDEKEEKHNAAMPRSSGPEKEKECVKWERVDMTLAGADIRPENIIKEEVSADFSQYFLANCPNGIKQVHSYGKVTIKNVYPGIDWVFYNSSSKGAKYDFVVHTGADQGLIQLLYSSKEKLRISDEGNIRIKTSYGDLIERAPETFLDGKLVKSEFKILSSSKNNLGGVDVVVGFELQTLDLRLGTLIIDPQLYWATFFGGSAFDGPRAVTSDNAGNVYVSGYTESANFPTQTGGGYFQGTFAGGGRDAFILKFSNAGVRLWSTYYGGSLTDEGWSLATDNAGDLFVLGYTESANFPLQNSGTFFQGAYGGQGDAFILKFDNAGNRQWATYYGGINMEEGFGIATDPAGNIFLTGETRSATTFPLLNAGTFYQGVYGTGTSDAFILKFDNAGNRLWATYAGGWNTDMGNAITTDAAGNVFVTGYAWGGGFPVQNAGTFFQGAVTGSGDLFIMKFSNTGALLWSTYYGGGAVDEGNSIVADAGGNIFITGTTASTAFPTFNPGGGAYFQAAKGGTWDTYMLKFDNAGNRLWATYFGGSGDEAYWQYSFDNLAVDACGNVYMSAETQSANLPTKQSCDNGYYDNSFNGGTYDLFVTQFSNSGALLWSTYLAGSGNDFRSPIAVDKSNSLFVSGEWTEDPGPPVIPVIPATYPLTNPGGSTYNNPFTGGHDGIMVKFDKIPPVLTTSVVNSSCGCTGSATANPAGICSPFNYLWSNGQTTQTITGLCAGIYSVTVGNSLCGTVTGTVSITSSGGFTVTPTSIPTACLSANGSATVTATGGTPSFTYLWSPSGGTNSIATGLAAGNYTVVVTDANGCSVTTPLIITSTGGPALTLNTQTNNLCNGSSNGAASFMASGGTSPYTYSWSPSGGSSSSATGLSAGTYTVSVYDSNSCLQTQTVTITQPLAITSTVSSTPASCGNNSGTATVSVSGGSGAYTFLWNPSAATTATATGLQAGNYSVTITDSNGCTKIDIVAVSATGSVSATANPAAICAGQTATLTASGGTNYSWNTGATTSSINVTATTTTTYTVIVSLGSCADTAFAVVSVVSSPVANAGTNQTVCMGTVVTLNATGGGSYLWSNGQSTSSITASPTSTATYSVTVTNSAGCTDVSLVTVVATPSVVANAGPDQTICTGSSVSLSASGGTSYSWIPATGLSNPNIYNPIASPPGTTTYSVIVSSGSCPSASAIVNVLVNTGPVASAASNVTISPGQSTTLSAGGGGTYLWSNGATDSPIVVAPLVTTIYCVTVTDASSCSDTACVTVYVEPLNCAGVSTEDAFVLPNAFSPNTDSQNDKWRMLYTSLLADCIAEFHVAVYNRWGERVFEGLTIDFFWDGMYNDKPENTGVFAFYLNASLRDGTVIKKKGNISLLR